MILSYQTILKYPQMITPMEPRTVHQQTGMSYGLSTCGYDIRLKSGMFIQTGVFSLGSTLERFDMPANIVGVVHDKSTLARLGIAVQNTVIEPGWRGWLTLEISNHSRRLIELFDGQPIAQVLFHFLDEVSEIPYAGKYQDQEDRPVEAKFEGV